ncbi:MAG: SDR family NAD(P)-dependent oxidoreductase [Bradymonadaceae bacterium]|nr:SDR family NAD(P)-dependent oxidoreductase [Lujinxingiaceae bacterium]
MKIAIITGASAGLGWEFARQLDGSDEIDELWLVARRQDKLDELAAELKKTPARTFAIDLTNPEQLRQLFDALEEGKPTISWLINNAGFGKVGAFDSFDVDTNLNMIDLNVRSLTEITQRALPYCAKGSKILQIASSAGWLPLTNFAVYAATKAYVVNFSNALSQELKSRGISVTAVCPGPVRTEFQELATNSGTTMDTPEFMWAEAPEVVARAIADGRKGRLNSIYGATTKTFGVLSGLVPRSLAIWASEKTYR